MKRRKRRSETEAAMESKCEREVEWCCLLSPKLTFWEKVGFMENKRL